MSMKEINPKDTTRAAAFELWMKAPNPMVTFFKTFDVMPLVKKSKQEGLKFNMLLDFCIGKAAAPVKEFYLLPIGDKLYQFDCIAVNTIVANKVLLTISFQFHHTQMDGAHAGKFLKNLQDEIEKLR